MNTPYHDLESTVQRYVLGKLTEAEAQEFEAFYLSNPELIEMVEAAQNIQIGLANEPLINTKRSPQKRDSWVQTVTGWLTVPVPAFAVLAIAAIVAPLLLTGGGINITPQQITLVSFTTSTTRGLESVKSIDLTTEGTTALMIKLKTASHPQYKLKVFKAGENDPIWISNKFQVSGLLDQLVVIPDQAKINNATIVVVGVDKQANESPVEFCHYSELCR